MSKRLTRLLTNLSIDQDLAEKFKADREGTMRAHGIDEQHIKLVVNQQYDQIQAILGDGYDINSNHIIKAFKKETVDG